MEWGWRTVSIVTIGAAASEDVEKFNDAVLPTDDVANDPVGFGDQSWKPPPGKRTTARVIILCRSNLLRGYVC